SFVAWQLLCAVWGVGGRDEFGPVIHLGVDAGWRCRRVPADDDHGRRSVDVGFGGFDADPGADDCVIPGPPDRTAVDQSWREWKCYRRHDEDFAESRIESEQPDHSLGM